nr:hypothetical protein [Kibdelosporangium sp. MJ126-NF4]CTQ88999.1 hypothetical protein [Kibdelosporangium sp. MJ126-NF4]
MLSTAHWTPSQVVKPIRMGGRTVVTQVTSSVHHAVFRATTMV